MDIYENIVVGNFLFGLGATVALHHAAQNTPPMAVNLLQQTPLDKPLGDVLLENSTAARLIEFKREANDGEKEKSKLRTLKALLAKPAHAHLVPVSREIHWYVETKQVFADFKVRVVPYLDFLTDIGHPNFARFIEDCAAALAASTPTNMKHCRQYIDLLRAAPGSVSTSSGGLMIALEEGKIKYAAVEEFRDFRRPIPLILERMKQREMARIKEFEAELALERQSKSVTNDGPSL